MLEYTKVSYHILSHFKLSFWFNFSIPQFYEYIKSIQTLWYISRNINSVSIFFHVFSFLHICGAVCSVILFVQLFTISFFFKKMKLICFLQLYPENILLSDFLLNCYVPWFLKVQISFFVSIVVLPCLCSNMC